VRQLLTWRFFAAIGSVVGLAVFVNAAFSGDDRAVAELAAPFVADERRPELISLVLEIEAPFFAISDSGQATTDLVLTLPPDNRAVRIFAGTPGEVSCTELTTFGRCAVLAELLGDTVTWFALTPMAESFRIELPAIVELDGGLAHLTNGWAVPYAPIIDRSRCGHPGESFGEFLRTVGQSHRTLFDLGDGEIFAVICPNDPAP